MATKPKGGKRSDAKTEIEDLDVREVSVVDRPAIRRKFLIVKSEDGLEVIRQEEDPKMAKNKDTETVDEHGILDLLDVNKDEEGEGGATKAVDRLMVLAATLKDEEGDTITQESCDELCSITEALAGKPVDKVETAKLTPHEAEERVSKAVGQMMIVAKQAEDGGESELESQCQAIGSELAPLAKDEGSISNQDGTLKVFVVAGGGEDPEIMIQKAGAKMKRSRLSAFEKAVQTLVTLLSEIKGEPQDKNKKKDKTQKSSEEDQDMSTKDEKDTKDTKTDDKAEVNKDDKDTKPEDKQEAKPEDKQDGDETVTKSWVKEQINEAVTKGLEGVTSTIKEMGDKFSDGLDKLTKRMDEVDETAPAGEGDGGEDGGDAEATEKKDKPFWGGRFLQ